MKNITLILTATALFTGCLSSQNKLEEFTGNEKLKYDLSLKDNLTYINTYAFNKNLCLNIDVKSLRKNYESYLSYQMNVDINSLTDNDFKYFFINGIAQNGLMGDKKTKKLFEESELRNWFKPIKFNGKYALYSSSDKLAMFENEQECYKFLENRGK